MRGIILSIALLVVAVNGYTGDDKFIKKYAMMKVYEACFGTDVVKEVRKEMKVAAMKCTGVTVASTTTTASTVSPLKIHAPQFNQLGQRHKPQQSQVNRISVEPSEVAHTPETTSHVAPLQIDDQTKTSGIDLAKLQQAILAGYNKHLNQQQHHQHQQHPQSFAQQPQSYTQQPLYQSQPQQSQFRPFYQQYQQQYPQYQQPQPSFNGYYMQQPQIYQPQPQYIQYPVYQPVYNSYPSYTSGQRGSRDLDVHGQLETLASSMNGKMRNVTCIMQELGYLDQNLEPDYQRMKERISRLPVQEELKKDMSEGVDFCKQFSQCLPDDKKDKLVREMVRPMFFFRCYKHKKLEACIMKDVRERYAAHEETGEDNLSTSENRSAKEIPRDGISTAIYEFLYGDENFSSDSMM